MGSGSSLQYCFNTEDIEKTSCSFSENWKASSSGLLVISNGLSQGRRTTYLVRYPAPTIFFLD